MITTDFTYIFLNLFMLMIFTFMGYCIQHDSQKRYWTFAMWCVFTFTLVLGLRYGRGNDYMHYIDVYKYDLESNEFLFTSINHLLKSLGVGEHYFFMYYNFLFIVGGLSLLKLFRNIAHVLFPLFVIAFTFFSEFIIRQALGFSFVFLFLRILLKDTKGMYDYIFLVFFAFCAFSIHSANVVYLFLFFLLSIFIHQPFKPRLTIPAFFFCSYIFASIVDYSSLTSYFSLLGGMDNKVGEYASDSTVWLSADNDNQEQYLRNPIIKLWQTYGECSLLFLGYKAIKICNDRKFILTYNVYVVGLMILQSFWTFEFLSRVGYIIYWFWAFPLGLVLHYFSIFWSKNFTYKILLFGLSFYIYEYLKLLLLRPNGMYKFIWDVVF